MTTRVAIEVEDRCPQPGASDEALDPLLAARCALVRWAAVLRQPVDPGRRVETGERVAGRCLGDADPHCHRLALDQPRADERLDADLDDEALLDGAFVESGRPGLWGRSGLRVGGGGGESSRDEEEADPRDPPPARLAPPQLRRSVDASPPVGTVRGSSRALSGRSGDAALGSLGSRVSPDSGWWMTLA